MEVKEIQDEIFTTYVRDPTARGGYPTKPSAGPEEARREGQRASSSVLDEETIHDIANRINEFMRSMNYSLQFIPDRESGMVIIRVLDGKGKVVRQIPPEELASISSMLGERIGMLLNERWG